MRNPLAAPQPPDPLDGIDQPVDAEPMTAQERADALAREAALSHVKALRARLADVRARRKLESREWAAEELAGRERLLLSSVRREEEELAGLAPAVPPQQPARLLTAREVCRALGISQRTLRRRLADRTLPSATAHRPGHHGGTPQLAFDDHWLEQARHALGKENR